MKTDSIANVQFTNSRPASRRQRPFANHIKPRLGESVRNPTEGLDR
jgi:hypothetical protein